MIQKRLEELRDEFARGQAQMKVFERQQAELRDTLLRIQGAIQVLEELSVRQATATNGAGVDKEGS